MLKIVSVAGARPQFVKAGVLSAALKGRAEEKLVHTGQHYDGNMSDIFFEQLGIPEPSYRLHAGSGTHGAQTARMLDGVERILLAERPDLVIVYGDTNSTLAGSLAAAKLHIPIAHVEAGLRSGNRRMPEEVNRILADHLSDYLLCPTDTAVRHLKKEGIRRNVHMVGDIMFDCLLKYRREAIRRSELPRRLGLQPGGYAAATVHRAENTDDPEALRGILRAFLSLGMPVVWPLHPRTKAKLEGFGLAPLLASDRLHVVEPLGYLDMLALASQARRVLTDSGGLQKEAYMLGVPCVTLRRETEWMETVRAGWNRLAGTDPARIVQAVADFDVPTARPPLFGDGRAAERIVALLTRARPKP